VEETISIVGGLGALCESSAARSRLSVVRLPPSSPSRRTMAFTVPLEVNCRRRDAADLRIAVQDPCPQTNKVATS
jgi:hypothetical protein